MAASTLWPLSPLFSLQFALHSVSLPIKRKRKQSKRRQHHTHAGTGLHKIILLALSLAWQACESQLCHYATATAPTTTTMFPPHVGHLPLLSLARLRRLLLNKTLLASFSIGVFTAAATVGATLRSRSLTRLQLLLASRELQHSQMFTTTGAAADWTGACLQPLACYALPLPLQPPTAINL